MASIRLRESYDETKKLHKGAEVLKVARDEEVNKCKVDIDVLKTSVDEIKSSVAVLRSLNMDEFLKKHENMKRFHNELSTDHSQTKMDIKEILDEIHKRIDTLERTLL